MSLLPFLHRITENQNLTCAEAREAMETILTGRASHAQMAAFLVALRMKGETVEELVGFARAMRSMAASIDHGLQGETLLDTCGTGGDGLYTFNISTVAAFVVAGAGVRVAKHGNRSISSQCGSADLLEGMGIHVAIPPQAVGRAIREIGIGFLFAPAIHTAMKNAQPVRLELKTRTVFNLLGPLTNPAGASAQITGAASAQTAALIAGALAALGLDRGLVVHGSDGLDEITTTGATQAWEIRGGEVTEQILKPSDFGIPTASPADLKGGDKGRNCEIAIQILSGARGPQRDIVLVNASAALVVCGKATDFSDGMTQASVSIDSGAALQKAEQLARFTQQWA